MNNRIIVIDDEQDFLESVKRGLITSGFKNVRTETDPLKAAADFENEEDYDIGLIDITMPGMDGIELLEIIKTYSPKTECIMITAVDEARMAVQCLRKGAYDYLVKPISKEDLVVSLKRALERKKFVDILDLGKSESIPKIVNMEAFTLQQELDTGEEITHPEVTPDGKYLFCAGGFQSCMRRFAICGGGAGHRP